MKAKQDKYIDLNQFVHKNGKISWKDSVGIIAEFFYNGERHELEILEQISKDYFKIRVDDIVLGKAHTSKIAKLMFDRIFYKPDYIYNVGDVINNIEIVKQIIVNRNSNKGSGITRTKGYQCKCLKDGCIFDRMEHELNKGIGCPVCSNTTIIKGINDIATTNPDLIQFFINKEDAYKYSKCSDVFIDVKCPYCGYIKSMRMSELSKYGYVTCDKCSDGISYPNKFAHELFSQLKKQYSKYIFEYSPDLAGLYRYDNYIELFNGKRIIVEMDGGYHYIKSNTTIRTNDIEKDRLCKSHGVEIIRVDCNYAKTHERYNYVKDNIVKELSCYFDLSNVDWNKCNDVGLSNYLFKVIDYYNSNPKLGLDDIANYFGICMGTMYSYLYMGEDLGLCKYIRADSNRIKNSKPVAMYTLDLDLIGIFKSAKVIEETFPEKDFKNRSIRKYMSLNKPYKGYIFKLATYGEYQSFDYNNCKQII